MNLNKLVENALDKQRFLSIDDYFDFCEKFLTFIQSNLQAVIVSQNENKYRFYQYKDDGFFNVTRPINNDLMLSITQVQRQRKKFLKILLELKKAKGTNDFSTDTNVNELVYSAQQSIGAVLDALPANKANFARKLNGDLFERFVLLILKAIGIDVDSGILSVPIIVDGKEQFKMKYQHDLIIKVDDDTRAIGSVKTSSKDRLDKIFVDKYLYNKLTDTNIPHFAVFLNDVQRKGKEGRYGVSGTFLPGHFKGYTVKLNSLDGVYYLDSRPNMETDNILKKYVHRFDKLLIKDIWTFLKL